MRIASSNKQYVKEIRFDGVHISDHSLNLLSEKLANLYSQIQSLSGSHTLNVVFDFNFLSVRSRRLVGRFLIGISNYCTANSEKKVSVEWRYDYMDDDMKELGLAYAESSNLNFVFVGTEPYSLSKAV